MKEQKLYRCSAIDKIITYDGGIIIRLIYDHLFYKANDVEIEVGNNTTINKRIWLMSFYFKSSVSCEHCENN